MKAIIVGTEDMLCIIDTYSELTEISVGSYRDFTEYAVESVLTGEDVRAKETLFAVHGLDRELYDNNYRLHMVEAMLSDLVEFIDVLFERTIMHPRKHTHLAGWYSDAVLLRLT